MVAERNFTDYLNFALPIGGLVVTAILFSLTTLFVKNPWIIYTAGTVGIGAPFFFVEARSVTVGVLIFSILLILLAVRRIRKDFKMSIGFGLHKTLKTGLPLFFSVSSLLVATYYLSVLTEEKAVSSLLPKPAFDVTFRALEEPLSGLIGLPIKNGDSTIDEVLSELLEDKLKSQGVSLSQVAQSELKRLVKTQRQDLSKNFGLELSGNEKISDVFYNLISVRIQDLLGPYKSYIPYVSAISIFLAFKTFTLPLYYFSLLITFLLIRLMIATNMLKVEKTSIEVEKLTL